MKKLTISDIASMAGVSTATISNYLNGNFKKMSSETRNKLEQIINQTAYRPNSIARRLAKNENSTIGVSIADITNPFASTIVSGISKVCENLGYRMVFTNSDNNEETESNNILKLQSEDVAGLIIDPVNPDSPIFKTLDNSSTVIIDRQSTTHPITVDTINTDNYDSVKRMVSLMTDNDYDDLYFVTWPLENVSTRQWRYRGFLEATGYDHGEHLLIIPHNGRDAEYEAFKKNIANLMNQKGDKKIGFFTMNARVFIRFIQAMQANNFSYPDDFGLATYEEFNWMTIIRPRVSCIRQDSYKIGTWAAEILNKKIVTKGYSEPPKMHIVPTSTVIHDSF